jgi:hypothetical protein
VEFLTPAADLQSLLKGSLLILGQEEVDNIFPLAQSLLAFHHHGPA